MPEATQAASASATAAATPRTIATSVELLARDRARDASARARSSAAPNTPRRLGRRACSSAIRRAQAPAGDSAARRCGCPEASPPFRRRPAARRARGRIAISARERMAEVLDAAAEASIEFVLMRERRQRQRDALTRARLLRVVEPRSGRKEIEDRPGVAQAARSVLAKRRLNTPKSTSTTRSGFDARDVHGRAQHRCEQLRNARNRRERTHARPARVIAPEREAGRPRIAMRADAFELRLRIESPDRPPPARAALDSPDGSPVEKKYFTAESASEQRRATALLQYAALRRRLEKRDDLAAGIGRDLAPSSLRSPARR